MYSDTLTVHLPEALVALSSAGAVLWTASLVIGQLNRAPALRAHIIGSLGYTGFAFFAPIAALLIPASIRAGAIAFLILYTANAIRYVWEAIVLFKKTRLTPNYEAVDSYVRILVSHTFVSLIPIAVIAFFPTPFVVGCVSAITLFAAYQIIVWQFTVNPPRSAGQ